MRQEANASETGTGHHREVIILVHKTSGGQSPDGSSTNDIQYDSKWVQLIIACLCSIIVLIIVGLQKLMINQSING